MLTTLLAATFLGTLVNYAVNVPLRSIAGYFHAPLSAGVLVVSSFVIVLAAGMTLSGWVGDRIGRKRVLVVALALMSAALAGAALSPSLPVLIAMRAVQGLACAAIPPAVMGVLSRAYPAGRGARAMGAWAGANGVGQAVGPPFGGLVAGALGWRFIFWLLALVTIVVMVAAARCLPADRGRVASLHWPGAVTLTLGSALLMTAATAVPEHILPVGAEVAAAGVAAACLAAFAWVSVRADHPLADPRLIVESRFLRSTIAACAQMFALSTVAVAVPLYLTGELGRSTAVAGALLFALPATMALSAPFIGALSDRTSPRLVLRAGLVLLASAALLLGLFTERGGRSLPALVGLLVAAGIGVALVQTPSAAGVTRAPAGRTGTALGLFNMMRFAGSAFGAAWVATLYPRGSFFLLFAGSAALLAGGLAVSFAGPSPVDGQPPGQAGKSGITSRLTARLVSKSISSLCASHTSNRCSAWRRSRSSTWDARSILYSMVLRWMCSSRAAAFRLPPDLM